MTKLMLLGLAIGAMAFGASSVYDFTLNSIDGAAAPLSSFKGKVVLLVNVASKCGYTPQYAGLEKLYETYKDKGFVIVGVPANNFGAQEPGSNEEIKTFCSRNYNVTFPLMSKVSVKGRGHHTAVPVPHGQDRQPQDGRRHQMELHEVPGGQERQCNQSFRVRRHARIDGIGEGRRGCVSAIGTRRGIFSWSILLAGASI